MTKKTSAKYSPEERARAVRMVLEHQGEYGSQWSAIVSIASKIGCTGETLRKWVRRSASMCAVASSAALYPRPGCGR